MNNQSLQTVTLQTAVLMQVKEFAAANKAFSVHDITREVRQKVNSGTLEIPEVEVAGASFRFDISHAKVKSLFDELWRNGMFDPDFSLNRNFNGQYFEYTPQAVAVSAPVPTFTVSQPPVVPPTTTTTTTQLVVATTTPDMKVRIESYLTNCKNRGFQPTLKQVQSAIKRGNESTGLSCEDLYDVILMDLHHTFTVGDCLSECQVIYR